MPVDPVVPEVSTIPLIGWLYVCIRALERTQKQQKCSNLDMHVKVQGSDGNSWALQASLYKGIA